MSTFLYEGPVRVEVNGHHGGLDGWKPTRMQFYCDGASVRIHGSAADGVHYTELTVSGRMSSGARGEDPTDVRLAKAVLDGEDGAVFALIDCLLETRRDDELLALKRRVRELEEVAATFANYASDHYKTDKSFGHYVYVRAEHVLRAREAIDAGE